MTKKNLIEKILIKKILMKKNLLEKIKRYLYNRILKFIFEASKNLFINFFVYIWKQLIILKTLKIFWYTYIKMVNECSQKIKESFKKKHTKGTKIFLKKKKTKNVSIIGIKIKIFLKMKNKGKLYI